MNIVINHCITSAYHCNNYKKENYMDWLREETDYSIEEIELIRYGLTSIVMELSKFFIMLLLFAVTRNGMLYLFGVFILLILRSCSGGLHFSSYIGCLIFSICILYMGCIFLPSVFQLSDYTMLILLICCIFITFQTGPVVSKSRPNLTPLQVKESKRSSFKIILCYMIAVILFGESSFIQPGFWMIFLQTLQLLVSFLLSKIKQRRSICFINIIQKENDENI